eukprot:Gb_18518 [translate_table: standard]
MWKFQGDVYILSGTSGTCIMQVFGQTCGIFAILYNGELKHYNQEVVLSDVYDKWIHLSVIHFVHSSISIDEEEKLVSNNNGKAKH